MPHSLRMTPMRWSGWGDPAHAVSLPPRLRALLENALGVRPPERPTVTLDEIGLPAPGFDPVGLGAIVGEGYVRTSAEDRIRHTRGKSTVDLLRIRAGAVHDAPDVVVVPGSHDEVLAILDWCTRQRIAVVPFGGGTSVVGGLAPDRTGFAGVVALDLARLDTFEIDPVSRTATLGAGLRAPVAEELLAAQGFTLGHFPQSFEYATIGGFAATRSSGQYSVRYGRFDELVVALRVATARGTVDLGRAPRSGAGPDLRQLFLGSEGTLGVITEVTVRLHRAPTRYAYTGWRFGTFPDGVAALRRLAQDGPVPAMLRLSDEYETALTGPTTDGGCLAVVAYEDGPVPAVEAVLRDAGGTPLGERPGQDWARGRFQGPYLRDALLDAGAFAETVETATFWSGLPALYEAVRSSLLESVPGFVLGHVSHVYPTGASLYFTIVCAQGPDPVSQWQQAKQAVNAAILGAGGTISHHHGVGTDHAAGLAEEIGPLMLDTLRSVKRQLDPAGILNPGILLARDSG